MSWAVTISGNTPINIYLRWNKMWDKEYYDLDKMTAEFLNGCD